MNYLNQLASIEKKIINNKYEYGFDLVLFYFFKTLPFFCFVFMYSYFFKFEMSYMKINFIYFLINTICCFIISFLVNTICIIQYCHFKRSKHDPYLSSPLVFSFGMVFGSQLINFLKSLKIYFFEKKNINLNEKQDKIIKKIITNEKVLKEIILMKKTKEEKIIYKKYIYSSLSNDYNNDLDEKEIIALQSLNKKINIY